MNIAILLSPSKTQYFINQAYINYVAESGLQPICIVPAGSIDEQLKNVDGLMIPGGIDLDPMYYGYDNDSSIDVDPARDAFEREVFHKFRESGRPIFGICRGFQLIIRELLAHDLSMSKYMHYAQHVDKHQQGSQQLQRSVTQHFVNFRPDLLYGEEDRKEYVKPVNSMHHQGVIVNFKDEKIRGFRAFRMAAWTDRGVHYSKDAPHAVVCEAFRILNWGAPILAVQWHPEELVDKELIGNFFRGTGNTNYDHIQTIENTPNNYKVTKKMVDDSLKTKRVN